MFSLLTTYKLPLGCSGPTIVAICQSRPRTTFIEYILFTSEQSPAQLRAVRGNLYEADCASCHWVAGQYNQGREDERIATRVRIILGYYFHSRVLIQKVGERKDLLGVPENCDAAVKVHTRALVACQTSYPSCWNKGKRRLFCSPLAFTLPHQLGDEHTMDMSCQRNSRIHTEWRYAGDGKDLIVWACLSTCIGQTHHTTSSARRYVDTK